MLISLQFWPVISSGGGGGGDGGGFKALTPFPSEKKTIVYHKTVEQH